MDFNQRTYTYYKVWNYLFLKSNYDHTHTLNVLVPNYGIKSNVFELCVERQKETLHLQNFNSYVIHLENTINSEITKAKTSFESSLINKFTSCRDYSIFRFIKSLTKCKTLPSSLHSDLGLAESEIDKANAFNHQYFYSVFSQSSVVLPNSDNLPHVENSISYPIIMFLSL